MDVDEIRLYSAPELGVDAQLFATFNLRNVDPTQPYILESAVGLDPDQIYPVFSGSYFHTDGTTREKYFDMVLPSRNVGFKIKLNPQLGVSTYSSLRDDLYKLISRSRTGLVEVRLMYNTEMVASITGLISKLESSLFDLDPKVTLGLSCQDPMLKGALVDGEADVVTLYNRYTFEETISTAPHGMLLVLKCLYGLNSLTIESEVSTGVDKHIFKINKSFLVNDLIYVSSFDNDRALYYVRSGETTHLTDKLDPGAAWPMLFPGDNSFLLTAPRTDGIESLGTYLSVEHLYYQPTYWGV